MLSVLLLFATPATAMLPAPKGLKCKGTTTNTATLEWLSVASNVHLYDLGSAHDQALSIQVHHNKQLAESYLAAIFFDRASLVFKRFGPLLIVAH